MFSLCYLDDVKMTRFHHPWYGVHILEVVSEDCIYHRINGQSVCVFIACISAQWRIYIG